MKALVIETPGVVRLREIPEPPLPEGECRVAVTLAGICRTDLELARGYMGFSGVPGHEFVGVVTAGPAHLKGKRVVGEINAPEPGPDDAGKRPHIEDPRHHVPRSVLGILGRQGAFAETLTLPPENLLVVPDGVPDDVAVFTEPLAAAMQILEQLKVPHGPRALVIGDGKLGLLIAQVLKVHGADVTLRGRHVGKLELAKRWGVAIERADGQAATDAFPLVVEATGSPRGFQEALRRSAPRGTVILKSTYAPGELPELDAAKVVVDEIRIQGSRCGRFAPALQWLAEGKIDVRGLIETRMPLAQGAEAFSLAARRGVRKVLIEIGAAN
ncbi:MAG: zinc-binding dehydrogenase [Planctomycetes bacterium]|nr:zinc-binding dehydrogenase [Planctomycetota bacterium]